MPSRRRAAPVRPIALAAMFAAVSAAGCSHAQRPGGTSAAKSAGSPAPSPSGFYGAALPAHIRAPAFTLTDQHGRRVSLSQFRGQVLVIGFLDSTCGATCVLVAQQIRGALDELAHPAPALLVSVDPSADTTASVRRFLARVSLTSRVSYLTGSQVQVARILRAYHVSASPRSLADGGFATVLLVDRDGAERILYGVEQLTPESLAHDIGKLQSG